MFGTSEPKYRPLDVELARYADEVMRQVRVDRIRADVETLAEPRGRLHAADEIRRAEQWIADSFRDAGWETECEPFTYESARGVLDYGEDGRSAAVTTYQRVDGRNVLAWKRKPSSASTIVVCAHFDSARGSPGADDNASGVATLLEVARVLSGSDCRGSVLLAALDMEEIGMFGGQALAERLRPLRGNTTALTLESVGYTTAEPGSQRLPSGIGMLYPGQAAKIQRRGHAGDWSLVVHRADSTDIARAFAETFMHFSGPDTAILARDPLDLPVLGALARRLPWAVDFARSDHVPLWAAGIPAALVTNTANFRNPHYHQPTDVPDTLDYGHIARIAAATAVVASNWQA
jgi:hypothetical protein